MSLRIKLKHCPEKLKERWLQDAHDLLTASGVPQWVEVESMPGNSLPHRLQWYLIRRKDVSEAETQRECPELNAMDSGNGRKASDRPGADSVLEDGNSHATSVSASPDSPAPRQNELSELLDQIEQRANMATAGKWKSKSHGRMPDGSDNPQYLVSSGGLLLTHLRLADASFIAAARSDVPALVKALRRALRHCEEFHSHADDTIATVAEIAQLLREPAESKKEN